MLPMKSLPDHGKAFWDMFPSDGDGGIVVSELSEDNPTGKRPEGSANATSESSKVAAA